jgi:hypothetical protein
MVGTTDLNKEYHPFGVMLTKVEKTKDYAFMFKCVQDLSLKIYNHYYNPKILVADCAPAITRGFKRVFEMVI